MAKLLGMIVLLSCFTGSLCCDINKCQTRNQVSPAACTEITSHLECLKAEFSKCTTTISRNKFMIMVPYSMRMYSSGFCGYDMDELQRMFMARVGLMSVMMNNTGGIPPMGFGDDGPFDDSDSDSDSDDDGPFDDGPFDDGPFDDGIFDDGPFDDSEESGMIHAVIAAGASAGNAPIAGNTQTAKPPQAPGLLPRFRGGAAMQTNDGYSGGGVAPVPFSLTTGILLCISAVYIL